MASECVIGRSFITSKHYVEKNTLYFNIFSGVAISCYVFQRKQHIANTPVAYTDG